MKQFSSKITVLVSYSVSDNIWELWFFVREFPIAVILNPSLKSRFTNEFSRFRELNILPLENKKTLKNVGNALKK